MSSTQVHEAHRASDALRGWKPHLQRVALPRDCRRQDARVPRVLRGWKPHPMGGRVALPRDHRGQDARVPRGGQMQRGNFLATRRHRIINHRNNRATGHPTIELRPRQSAALRTALDLGGRLGQLGLGVMTMDGRDDQPPRPFTSMSSTQVKKPAGLYTLLHVLHGSFPRSVSGGIGTNRSFNRSVHGLEVGGRAARAPARDDALRGWKLHLPLAGRASARLSRAGCPRPQGAARLEAAPPWAGICKPTNRPTVKPSNRQTVERRLPRPCCRCGGAIRGRWRRRPSQPSRLRRAR